MSVVAVLHCCRIVKPPPSAGPMYSCLKMSWNAWTPASLQPSRESLRACQVFDQCPPPAQRPVAETRNTPGMTGNGIAVQVSSRESLHLPMVLLGYLTSGGKEHDGK